MKKLMSLGCLLALALFAGATAQAKEWFANVAQQNLGDVTVGTWLNMTGWDWKFATDQVPAHGELTTWDAEHPLKYTPVALPQTGKDTAVSTHVKFSVMDYEDLKGAADISTAKAGLTVARDGDGDAAYYGIAQVGNEKDWVQLTGTPNDNYVTVTVELFKKGTDTFVNYKIGDTLLALAGSTTTDIPVDVNTTTIASVEYLGQCNIATLAGDAWSNPCKLTLTIPENAYVYVNDADEPLEAVEGVYSTDVARHGSAYFTLAAKKGYSLAGAVISPLSNINDDEAVDLTKSVTVTEIPSKEVVGGDVPTQITVDNTDILARLDNGATEGTLGYLYTKQSNDQLGWVNYSLGIADDAVIAPTNDVPVAGYVAIGFGVEVDPAPGTEVSYKVDNETTTDGTPDIKLSGTKADNNKIHEVAMVLKDEAGVEHVVSTVTVGVMETGKDVDATADEFTTYDIVAVPWESFGNAAITVADLLNTAMLTPGDVLYIQKETNGDVAYDQYELIEEAGVRSWDPKDSKAADKRTVAKGTAIWIERSNKSRIVFSGKLAEGATVVPATKTAAAGTPEKPTWTLIANPSIKPLDLSTITPNPGDKIVIEDIADPRQYEYKDGAWGYTKMEKVEYGNTGVMITKPTWVTNDNVVKPGIGFWYVNTGNAVTITFPANASATSH